MNPALYGLTAAQKANDFHDIAVGNNELVGTPTGNNAVSGWGTPDATNLVGGPSS